MPHVRIGQKQRRHIVYEFRSRGKSYFGFPVRLVWFAGQRDLDLLEQFLYNYGGDRAAQGQDDQADDGMQ